MNPKPRSYTPSTRAITTSTFLRQTESSPVVRRLLRRGGRYARDRTSPRRPSMRSTRGGQASGTLVEAARAKGTPPRGAATIWPLINGRTKTCGRGRRKRRVDLGRLQRDGLISSLKMKTRLCWRAERRSPRGSRDSHTSRAGAARRRWRRSGRQCAGRCWRKRRLALLNLPQKWSRCATCPTFWDVSHLYNK